MNPRTVLRRVRKLGLPAYGDDEVLFMASAMSRHRPTHVFEWGTNVGASARLFHEAAGVLGFACEVHTTELPDELAHLDRDHPGHRYGQWIDGLPIVAHRGDGLAESLHARDRIRPERSLFFLDGCHDYLVVLDELETVSAADPDAVILVHDTAWRESGAAVDAFLLANGGRYEREDVASTAGMVALWPST